MNEHELMHHGILGQKWGVRRFQNEDGSLTPDGKERYGKSKEDGMAKRSVRYGKSFADSTFAKNMSLKFPKPKIFMSDDELARRTDRLIRQKQYHQLKSDIGKLTFVGRTRQFAEDITAKTVKDTETMAYNAFNGFVSGGMSQLGRGVGGGIGQFIKDFLGMPLHEWKTDIDTSNKIRENRSKANDDIRKQRVKADIQRASAWATANNFQNLTLDEYVRQMNELQRQLNQARQQGFNPSQTNSQSQP